MAPSAQVIEQACKLVSTIAKETESEYGFSSMTVSIYDTGWLAMVRKDSAWFFPDSFTYLLDHQRTDGGWDLLSQITPDRIDAQYPESLSIPDSIVHSVAALLALCRHYRLDADDDDEMRSDLLRRITKAKHFLDEKLAVLKLNDVKHFSFILIVPVLLCLLEEEEPELGLGLGLHFTFPAKEKLPRQYEEASSVLTAFLEKGFTVEDLGVEAVNANIKKIRQLFSSDGVIGARPNRYAAQIDKVTRFLCAQWENKEERNNGELQDKLEYIPILRHHSHRDVSRTPAKPLYLGPSPIYRLIPDIDQNADGTWGTLHCCEETAYALVALAHLASLCPVTGCNTDRLDKSIARGKAFLRQH
ncbi:hypothetical protein BDW74DRAFT_177214 [Aspergillus multicolor]|uniref:uncharacterized protein n=1 Tax=Aspergillus multicolor TaxID=41759 RepID=UPI003CCE315E